MSKRKVVAGGYEDSSEESEPEPATTKKVRPAAAGLLPLDSHSNLRKGFQFPTTFTRPPPSIRVPSQTGSSRTGSVSAPTSFKLLVSGTPQSNDRPTLLDNDGKSSEYDLGASGAQAASQHPVDPKGTKPAWIFVDRLLVSRSTLGLERHVNELRTKKVIGGHPNADPDPPLSHARTEFRSGQSWYPNEPGGPRIPGSRSFLDQSSTDARAYQYRSDYMYP